MLSGFPALSFVSTGSRAVSTMPSILRPRALLIHKVAAIRISKLGCAYKQLNHRRCGAGEMTLSSIRVPTTQYVPSPACPTLVVAHLVVATTMTLSQQL